MLKQAELTPEEQLGTIAAQAYDRFLQALIQRHPQGVVVIHQALPSLSTMNLSEKLQQVDQLKGWLDSFRPLPPIIVAELKKLYDVKYLSLD